MKNSVAVVIPYFGKLPNYFNLWMNSVKYNSDIDVIFLTDISEPKQIPSNLIWKNISFNDVKKRAQKLVDFNISLPDPYKLTDFKPAYGEMFADYLRQYDWWGFGDIDTIWGNLNPILEQINSKMFDKVLSLGHLTFLKNSKKINSLYKIKAKHFWNYKNAFSTKKCLHFDEGGGFSFIAKAEKYRVYDEAPSNMNFADIIPNYSGFLLAYSNYKKPYIFSWTDGVLKGYWVANNKIFSKEFTYLHLQKRNMKLSINNGDINNYLIIPNEFIPFEKEKLKVQFVMQYNDLNYYNTKISVKNRILNRIKLSNIKYSILQKLKRIPINGNEVYFGVQKPKY